MRAYYFKQKNKKNKNTQKQKKKKKEKKRTTEQLKVGTPPKQHTLKDYSQSLLGGTL